MILEDIIFLVLIFSYFIQALIETAELKNPLESAENHFDIMDDESSSLKLTSKSNKVSGKVTIQTIIEDSDVECTNNELVMDKFVCTEMNLSRNDLDECKYTQLDRAQLDYTLKLTGKFIQFSGLHRYQDFGISISLSGEIDFNLKGVCE